MNIDAQALAVERAFVNARGHRDVVAGLVAKGRRPQHELDAIDQWLADLEPAAATMKWLAMNHEDIKSALRGTP
jgi:hypothetical protein